MRILLSSERRVPGKQYCQVQLTGCCVAPKQDQATMTAQLGEEVFIGCVDICGCGASVVNAAVGPSARLEVPLKDTAQLGIALSNDDEEKQPLELISVKNCTTDAGTQVSLLGINLLEDDNCPPIKVAHAVATMLRDTPSVQQVTLIGAAHLPSCPEGTLAVATANGAKPPAALEHCVQVPVREMLKGEMIASLHYWLLASGVPLVMCMVSSNRPAAGLRERSVDASACNALTKAVQSLVQVQVDQKVIARTVMIGSGPKSGPVVDSLMYM